VLEGKDSNVWLDAVPRRLRIPPFFPTTVLETPGALRMMVDGCMRSGWPSPKIYQATPELACYCVTKLATVCEDDNKYIPYNMSCLFEQNSIRVCSLLPVHVNGGHSINTKRLRGVAPQVIQNK